MKFWQKTTWTILRLLAMVVQLEEMTRPLIWLVTRLLRVETELKKVLSFEVNAVMLLVNCWLVVRRLWSWSEMPV